MPLETVTHKTLAARGGAAMQRGVGALLVIASLITLFASWDYNVTAGTLRAIMAVVGFFGARMWWKGSSSRRLTRLLPELDKLFASTERVSLEAAASYLRCTITQLVRDVRELQKRGYVRGLYADLIRRDLVSVGSGVASTPAGSPPDDGTILKEEWHRSTAPLYALGLTWVAWALALPMYTTLHFVLVAALSVAVFFTVRARTSEHLVIVERVKAAPPPPNTGNETLDDMLVSAQKHMDDLRRLDESLNDGKADAVVREILQTTERIVEHVRQHPNSAQQIRQFLGYTLPTTINLLQNYDELCRQPVAGENITQAKQKIEGMMDTMVAAFHRQLDALFREKALNIEVELDVMKEMLHNASGDVFQRPKQEP